jgi:CRP-like cAMP-binding protein
MPQFASLQPAELDALTPRLEELSLPAGRVVVRQGEPGDRFYLVRDGELSVSLRDEHGRERQVARLGPGEYFGEIALLLDQPRTATVTTWSATRLFVLRKSDFDALLSRPGETSRELELVASRRRLDLGSRSGAQ